MPEIITSIRAAQKNMSELIAFIGVGNMGNPMANNLVKAGKKVKVFDAMLSYHNSLRIREEAVRKQNEYRLQKDCLRYLRIKARELRGERIIRCQRADVFYRKKLVLNLFGSWKTVMPMLREEKKASLRRRALRSKVNSWLKDDDRL